MHAAAAGPPAAPPDGVAVLDIEASGFGRNSYPVEVGFVLPDGRSYCTLIRPAPAWTHWDPRAEDMHHITLDMARRHGRDAAEVAAVLNHELRGRTLYCDGWAHDYVWLSVLYDEAGTSPAFKLDNLRALLTDGQAARWAQIKAQVSAELKLERHRASSDARVLQRTLTLVRAHAAAAAPGAGTP